MRRPGESVPRVVRLVAGALILLAMVIGLEFAFSDWHGHNAYRPLIPREQADQVAIATISRSQSGASQWTVTDSAFHNESTTVTDRMGNRRFASSWNPCPWGGAGAVLNRVGITCPPPPVWAIQVSTSSRPTGRKALVEVDATSGAVVSWLIDDSLP